MPWWRHAPLPIETVLYCPLCRAEIDRHYPTNLGLFDVRCMIEAAEKRPCPSCRRTLHRSQGFTFDQVAVPPEERGYRVCQGCGIVAQETSFALLGRGQPGSPYQCIGCYTLGVVRDTNAEGNEWQ